MDSIDQIITGHDRHRLSRLHRNLKSFQINLTQRALGKDTVGVLPVILLVVARKMLDGGSAARNPLDPLCHSGGHPSGEQRILGVVFKIPAAERIPVDIHARGKPECDAELHHFTTDHLPGLLNQLCIPGLCQQRSHRYGRTVLIIPFSREPVRIRAEDPALNAELKRHCHDLSLIYIIILHQPQTSRTVSQDDPRQVLCLCAVMRLPGRSRHRDSRRPQVSSLRLARIPG